MSCCIYGQRDLCVMPFKCTIMIVCALYYTCVHQILFVKFFILFSIIMIVECYVHLENNLCNLLKKYSPYMLSMCTLK